MRTAIITSILALFFLTAGATSLIAASDKCTVVEATGKRLVLECRKETSKFKEGTGVKIKSERKGAAVEGC